MEISDCQDTDPMNTNRQFSHRKILYNWNVFDADPDRRDKACSFGETWVLISRKIKIKMFFLELSDYQDTDAREKNKGSLVEYSFTRIVFLVEFLMEEIEQVLDEK